MAVKIDFSKIDFKDKNVQNLIGGIMLGIAAIWAFFHWAYGPMGVKIIDLEKKIQKKETKLEETRKKAEKLPELKKEYEALKGELADVEKKLPKKSDIPEILKIVTRIGREYSIDITNFKPRKSTREKYYTTYPMAMGINTTYHRLGLFMTKMGQQERVMGFKDLNISSSMDEDYNVSMTVGFTLCAYTFNE